MALRDPLNFFSPYERLPAGHENQLTRALLLVLRMSPIAHAEWLRQIEPDPPRRAPWALQALPAASFMTQRRAAREADAETEPAELVSVFLAPERPQDEDATVVESDRRQVLDAIVDYDGELLVVVENKVFEAEDLQARHINVHGAQVQLVDGQQVVVVLWRDLLEAFTALLDRGLVGGAEAEILGDFLTYVEDHFPELGPYRTLKLCAGIPTRVNRRLRQVLAEATKLEATLSPHGPRAAVNADDGAGRDAYLRLEEEDIALALYPADTLGQARSFFRRRGAVEGIRALAADDGWAVTPNFHFGHMQRGYCWMRSTISIDDYIDLWVGEIGSGRARSVPRSDWNQYWAWLVERGIALPEDRVAFDQAFTDTRRQDASPRPGLALRRVWTRKVAEELDSRGRFVGEVCGEIQRALRVIGAA